MKKLINLVGVHLAPSSENYIFMFKVGNDTHELLVLKDRQSEKVYNKLIELRPEELTKTTEAINQ